MYKLLLFIIVILLPGSVEAQNDFVPVKYWITFTDKQHNEYSIARPEEFLSNRAINRRINQNIQVDSTDLPVSSLYVDSLLADTSINIIYSSKWFNAVLAEVSSSTSIEKVENFDFVKDILYVKPKLSDSLNSKKENSIHNVKSSSVNPGMLLYENDLLWNNPLKRYSYNYSTPGYGYSKRQIELINGNSLHKSGYNGEGKIIALMDAGYTNVDSLEAFLYLWENGQIKGWRDFVDPESDIFRVHPHGTYVLSTMAALIDGQIYGTAVGAKYLLLRSEDANSEFLIEECNWIAAAEYADSAGVDIINTSLGYTRFDDPVQDHTYKDMDGNSTLISRASNYAFNKGILIVTSAGNYANNDWQYISAPADSYSSIAVGAVDNRGERARFSSVGPAYDDRIKPDVMAHGDSTIALNIYGQLIKASGTSLSAPLISGMAACLWQAHPDKNVNEIKKAIIESSNRAYYPDSLYGYGIPDFEKAYNLLKTDFRIEPLVKVFPNPFFDNFRVSLYFEEAVPVNLQLINLQGQIMFSDTYYATEGYNTFTPFNNMDVLNQGLYIFKIHTGNSSYTTRIIKSG